MSTKPSSILSFYALGKLLGVKVSREYPELSPKLQEKLRIFEAARLDLVKHISEELQEHHGRNGL